MYRSVLLSHRLPDDLVYDILTRLPVKSLIRFRCVSRSWYCTITDSDFITKHLDRANLLSKSNSNNGCLLCNPYRKGQYSSCDYLCTFVCNNDRTLTEISRFEFPSYDECLVGFSNGIICLANYADESSHILYLWNPSIRKFKRLLATPLIGPFDNAAFGFGYHSQNNDYKILRFVFFRTYCGVKFPPAEAEIYTLSTDSWRRVVISVESFCGTGPNESVDFIESSLCLFFNGALHSIAYSQDHNFILSFDVNDERFRKILLPPNYLNGVSVYTQYLAVFKGSLALIVFGESVAENSNICHIWVMKEYGVVESWTKRSVPMGEVGCFFGCTINGELLIEKYGDTQTQSLAFDPESLNAEILRIPEPACMIYTANFVESLVLLDGLNILSQSEK